MTRKSGAKWFYLNVSSFSEVLSNFQMIDLFMSLPMKVKTATSLPAVPIVQFTSWIDLKPLPRVFDQTMSFKGPSKTFLTNIS